MNAPHGRGSTDCREIFARLSEYLDGEIDPDLCARLEGHMGDCPPCRAFLESLRRTVAMTRDLPAGTLPDELKEELLESYRKLRQAGGR